MEIMRAVGEGTMAGGKKEKIGGLEIQHVSPGMSFIFTISTFLFH